MTTPEQPEQPHPTGLDRIAAIFATKRDARAAALATARSEISEVGELAAVKHADRAAALVAAQAEINEAAEREAAALKAQLAALEQARVDKLEAAGQAAEHTRRARAAALLAELFAPDSLPAQVATFRRDPTRQAAMVIRSTWDRFAERCQTEIGEALSKCVLEAAFIDDIVAEPGLAGAINRMSGVGGFGNGEAVGSALGRATHRLATPQGILDALVQLENALQCIAHQHRDAAPDADHIAHHALRRAHCTYRDLALAREELGKEQGARREAEIWRNYKPPPPYSALRSRYLSDGRLPPEE